MAKASAEGAQLERVNGYMGDMTCEMESARPVSDDRVLEAAMHICCHARRLNNRIRYGNGNAAVRQHARLTVTLWQCVQPTNYVHTQYALHVHYVRITRMGKYSSCVLCKRRWTVGRAGQDQRAEEAVHKKTPRETVNTI